MRLTCVSNDKLRPSHWTGLAWQEPAGGEDTFFGWRMEAIESRRVNFDFGLINFQIKDIFARFSASNTLLFVYGLQWMPMWSGICGQLDICVILMDKPDSLLRLHDRHLRALWQRQRRRRNVLSGSRNEHLPLLHLPRTAPCLL